MNKVIKEAAKKAIMRVSNNISEEYLIWICMKIRKGAVGFKSYHR